MSIITDRMNANKPPPPVDSKGGKLAPGALNNNKDLDVDAKKEEPSFFGSFFSAKNQPKKKGAAVMEAVSCLGALALLFSINFIGTLATCSDPTSGSAERPRDYGDGSD